MSAELLHTQLDEESIARDEAERELYHELVAADRLRLQYWHQLQGVKVAATVALAVDFNLCRSERNLGPSQIDRSERVDRRIIDHYFATAAVARASGVHARAEVNYWTIFAQHQEAIALNAAITAEELRDR